MKCRSLFTYVVSLVLLSVVSVFPSTLFAQSGTSFRIIERLAADPEFIRNLETTAEDQEVSAGSPPGIAKAAASSDYFPLYPGTTWTYQDNSGGSDTFTVLKNTTTVQGVKASIIQNSSSKHQAFYTNDEAGIRLHGQFSPSVDFAPRGKHSVRTRMDPPMLMWDGIATTGSFHRTGTVWAQISGLGPGYAYYTSDFTVTGTETITVPAGTFETVHLAYQLTMQGTTTEQETGDLYLAKNVGEVKESFINPDETAAYELASTNSGVHDFAVTALSAPASVTLTKKVTSKTSPVKVTIQNRSLYSETIQDMAALASLVTVTAESLGARTCPDPVPVVSAKQSKKFPVILKSKGTLVVNYDVTFNCANDPAKSTPKDPTHYDYRFSAAVNTAALGGPADGHTVDDGCPRSVTAPYEIDPYPDGTIKDKGCGARKADGTYGGEILTDVVVTK